MTIATNFAEVSKHLTLTSASDIEAIIMPLLRPHGIRYFNFYKEFYDGTVIRLCNHRDWSEHYFKNNYLNRTTAIPASFLQKKTNYYIWTPDDWLNDVLVDAATNFNISNGISITKVYPNAIESFGFGADLNNRQINNFYINNLDWLEKCCDYFKDVADSIIKKHERNRIILPSYIQKDKLAIIDKLIPIKLSKQQMSCSRLLLLGYTTKKIAAQLQLSPRTVEYYFAIIKAKLNCRSKTELILRLNKLLSLD